MLNNIQTKIKEICDNCDKKMRNYSPFTPFHNPFKKNDNGIDRLTEKAWQLSLWKRENVFPIDIKLRALSVLMLTLLGLKGILKSF